MKVWGLAIVDWGPGFGVYANDENPPTFTWGRAWRLGLGLRLGLRFKGLGLCDWGLGFRVWGLGFWVEGFGFGVQSLGFGVLGQSLVFRVQGECPVGQV